MDRELDRVKKKAAESFCLLRNPIKSFNNKETEKWKNSPIRPTIFYEKYLKAA